MEDNRAQSEIGFWPSTGLVVVYAPPPERESESGLDLSQAESLDAHLPQRGTVVATGQYTSYALGEDVMIRRYVGIQMEVDGDRNYWILNEDANEILGRFDRSSPPSNGV